MVFALLYGWSRFSKEVFKALFKDSQDSIMHLIVLYLPLGKQRNVCPSKLRYSSPEVNK